ncbi:MAG: RHS repeat-associated core domain-containing protein, partial [Candidatus Muiribacteriota bacterium]
SLNLGAAQTPAFGFTSREFDEIADLYFYRSRYYDPTLGRFTQRDKFNEAGFITGNPAVIYNPLQLNDYTYVGNNPLIYTDPWGWCNERPIIRKIFGIFPLDLQTELTGIYTDINFPFIHFVRDEKILNDYAAAFGPFFIVYFKRFKNIDNYYVQQGFRIHEHTHSFQPPIGNIHKFEIEAYEEQKKYLNYILNNVTLDNKYKSEIQQEIIAIDIMINEHEQKIKRK